ncbi:MAG: hypothetical protein OSJ34_07330 [Muribaculaceae bacterium]|nr:hypothetical protein [Muribaculaceae bacterium]
MATLEEKEAARQQLAQRHKRICEDYRDLLKKNPDEAPYCLLDTLAHRYKEKNVKAGARIWPQTVPGIRHVVMQNGLFNTKRQQNEADM